MNFKKQSFVVAGIAFLSVSSSTAAQATKEPLQSTIPPAHTRSALVSQEDAVSLSRQIGEVEVERVLQLVRFHAETPVIEALDQRYVTLITQLRQVEPSDYQTWAASATQTALQAKIVELETTQRQQSRVFTSNTPMLQILQAELSGLRQRLDEVTQSSS